MAGEVFVCVRAADDFGEGRAEIFGTGGAGAAWKLAEKLSQEVFPAVKLKALLSIAALSLSASVASAQTAAVAAPPAPPALAPAVAPPAHVAVAAPHAAVAAALAP